MHAVPSSMDFRSRLIRGSSSFHSGIFPVPEPLHSEPQASRLLSTRLWMVAVTVTALLCISMLVLWSANDASFRMATWKAKVSLGIQRIPVADPETVEALGIMDAMRRIHWDRLGKRVIALYTLYAFGLGSTAALLFLTIRNCNTKRVVTCVLVVAAWVGMLATRSTVDDWRARRPAAVILPKLEEAASALHGQWPTESGEIPPGIEFYVSAELYPDVLLVRGRRDPYPLHEDLGLMIKRGRNGIIRFDLEARADCCVEFHPNGTQPSAHRSGFGHGTPPVALVFKLKDNWYLVRYAGS
jgi:hypothetical protein